jgi:hypothetical protein
LQRSIVFLYPTAEAASDASEAGGTGFLVCVRRERSDRVYTYLVTNIHVAQGAHRWVRMRSADEKTYAIVEIPGSSWVNHPDEDDVAVCPFETRPE